MKSSICISVVIACYNGEKYIENAILSVLNQPSSDIELIVIDDGSTDKTPEICHKYGNRIRYFRTENCGAGHARNMGIDVALGDWIVFLDADDLILDCSFTEKLIADLWIYFEKSVDVVYTSHAKAYMNLDDGLKIYYAEDIENINIIPQNEFVTCFYRSSFLKENNIRFYEYKKQDIESAFRYLAFSKSRNKIARRNIAFYLHRNNPQSNTHSWSWQTVLSIKAQVYYDLYLKHSTTNSKLFLLKMVFELIHKYFISIYNEKHYDKEEYVAICQLHKKLKINKDIELLDYTYKRLVFKDSVINAIIKLRKNRKKSNVILSDMKKIESVTIADKTLFSRLSILSGLIHNIVEDIN